MNESEKEIVFSQTIKAGKRIYYIDVKKNRKDEMYLSITESKKNVSKVDSETKTEQVKVAEKKVATKRKKKELS